MAQYKVQAVSAIGKTKDAMQRKLQKEKTLQKAKELTEQNKKPSKAKRK